MTAETTFGAQVRETREYMRPAMSQSGLAALARTDQSTISDIETGKKSYGDGLGGDLAGRVAHALDCQLVLRDGNGWQLMPKPAPADANTKGE